MRSSPAAVFLVTSSLSAAISAAVQGEELPASIRPDGPAASLAQSVGLVPEAPGALRGGGADYRARFDAGGMLFEPALGRGVERTQSFALSLDSIARGGTSILDLISAAEPGAEGMAAIYPRPAGVAERYELLPEGVELSFVFAEPLPGAGELAVRMALETTLPLPAAGEASELAFELEGAGGVRVGAVLGIDADGRTAAGSLRLADGALELVLPGEFVDAASYPLVLDPLIGPILNVSASATFDDARPDAAYDASADLYLAVWERTFSASDSDIRGQRVSSAGALVGGTIFFGSAGVATNPCVANANSPSAFAVAWQQSEASGFGTLYTIRVQAVDSETGTLGNSFAPASVLGSPVTDPDIGGDGVKNAGSDSRLILVYDDALTGELRGIRLWIDPAGALYQGATFTIVADNPGFFLFYARPSISRSAGVYSRLLVAYERYGLLGANATLRGQVIDLDGAFHGTDVQIASVPSGSALNADVDGHDRQFVVAWERDPDSGSTNVEARSLDHNVSLDTLTMSAIVAVTSASGFTAAGRPAVGYSFGKTFIGWRATNSLLGSSSFQIRGYDSKTCTSCEGPLTLASGGFDANEWIAVATPTSGGAYYDDRGLAVWSKTVSGNGDVQGQALANNALGGSITDLGGGCGPAGNMTFSTGPAIGSSWFIFGLQGLPADSTVAFLNFSPPSVPLTCGSCAWNLPVLMGTHTVISGQTSTAVTIPCKPQLVGDQFEAQWTVYTPASAPCAAFPGFSLSNRARVTIGQ